MTHFSAHWIRCKGRPDYITVNEPLTLKPWREQLGAVAVWILEAVRVEGWAESFDGNSALDGRRVDGGESVLVVGRELKGPVDVRVVVLARDRLLGADLDV